MAKVLLGQHNVEDYIDRDTKSIYVDRSFIIPPGIKDYLQTEGICLLYDKPEEAKENEPIKKKETGQSVPQKSSISEDSVCVLTKRIVSILKDKHQMTDEEVVKRICLNVINQIKL